MVSSTLRGGCGLKHIRDRRLHRQGQGGFIDPSGWMWIETSTRRERIAGPRGVSSTLRGGCGLKPVRHHAHPLAVAHVSSTLRGGCGLKRKYESFFRDLSSPVSSTLRGGCGLKQLVEVASVGLCLRFIDPSGWMWIETRTPGGLSPPPPPVSSTLRGGCGLKPICHPVTR